MSQDFTGVDPIKDRTAFVFSGPGGPVQCQTWPRWVYHATEAPRMISSEQDKEALGEGWSLEYIHRDYPKAKFHQETGEYRTVLDPEEEGKLEGNWGDKPPENPTKPAAYRDKTLQEVGEAVRDYRRLSLDYQQINQDLDTHVDNTAMQPIRREELPHPQYHPSASPATKRAVVEDKEDTPKKK